MCSAMMGKSWSYGAALTTDLSFSRSPSNENGDLRLELGRSGSLWKGRDLSRDIMLWYRFYSPKKLFSVAELITVANSIVHQEVGSLIMCVFYAPFRFTEARELPGGE